MFCTNCGRPTEGEQQLCPACAAARAQQNAPADPIGSDDGFTLNTPGSTGGKKKGKAGLIAAIVAGVLVLAAVLGIVFNLQSIESFFNRNLRSPKDYMVSVEQEALTGYADMITNAYGKLTEAAAENSGVSSSAAEVHLLLSEQLLSLAELGLSSEDMELELDFLSDILLETEQYVDGDKTCSNISIGLGDKPVLTLSVVQDLATGSTYIGLPELNEQYLLTTIPEEMRSTFTSALNLSTQLQDLPDQAAVEALAEKYVLLALSQIDTVEKDTVTLTAGGLEQKVTVLTTTVYEKDTLEMAIAILNAVKDEPELKKFCDAIAEYMNHISAYEYGTSDGSVDLYGEFTAAIPELISELEQMVEEADPANYITWVTYVDSHDTVVGRSFTVHGAEEAEPMELLRYFTVTEKDRFAFEGTLSELTVIGEGTKKNGMTNGQYSFTVDAQEIFRLEVRDLDELKLEEEHTLQGTFRLVPGEVLVESIFSGTGLPVSAMDGAVALELVLGDHFEFHILANSETLIGLTITSKIASASGVELPENTADINDEDAIIQWLTTLDYEKLATDMENAGIPSVLVEYVNAYASLMVDYYS